MNVLCGLFIFASKVTWSIHDLMIFLCVRDFEHGTWMFHHPRYKMFDIQFELYKIEVTPFFM